MRLAISKAVFAGSSCSVGHIYPTYANDRSGPCAGAVIYGTQPALISARRCRLWYGLWVSRKFDWELHSGINPMIDIALGQLRVNNVFDVIISRGELLQAGETRSRNSLVPAYATQETLSVRLYATSEPCTRASGVRLATDSGMRLIATLSVDLRPLIRQGVPLKDRGVKVQLRFGETELQMTATVVRTGQVLSTRVQYT